MLKAFSWPDFLLASIILSLLWWAVIWLIYFRRRGAGSAEPLSDNWEQSEEFEPDLMGKPLLDSGVSVMEADDFSFGLGVGDEILDEGTDLDPAPDKIEQLGDLADVQEEIREVFRLLAAEDGTKDDFFVLFEMVRNKYPKIALSLSLPALNGFIREHVPFALSDEELDGLWA